MKKPIICCPGSINPDLKLKTDTPKGAKTFRGIYSEDVGGKGSDTCGAIKNVCGKERKVYLVGCVGDDGWGDIAVSRLKEKKIEMKYVARTKGKTGIVLEYIYRNGEVSVGLDPGANRALTIEDVAKAKKVIARSALVIGQIENTVESLAYSFMLAHDTGVPTLLDPSVMPRNEHDRSMLFKHVLPYTTILMPDRDEFTALTGIKPEDKKSLAKGAKKLLEHCNCKILCVTLGSQGAFVSDRKQYRIIPPFTVEAVDGGGAGDVFRGVFGYKIIEYCENNNCTIDTTPFDALAGAARYANAAAAVAISRPGTFSAIPTKEEIERVWKGYP